jgi:hypothetical protein
VSGARDIRPDIFGAVKDRGWVLYEIDAEHRSLEKVFRELTIGGESMRHKEALTIMKRELRASFTSPVAYIVISIFLVFFGILLFQGFLLS